MTWKRGNTIALIALAIAGCSGAANLGGDAAADGARDVPADTAADTAADAAADAAADTADVAQDDGGGRPGITFILAFLTDIGGYEFLYAQRMDNSCRTTWVSVRQGERTVGMQGDCSICTCDVCANCPICGMCMIDLAKVGSGERVEYAWDATTYARDTCVPGADGHPIPCIREGALEPGSYTARFCWAIGGPDAYPPDGVIEEPTCEDVPFTYPVPGGIVRFTVDNSG